MARRPLVGGNPLRIFTYVIASDRGSAPNYDPPCFTLAVCKPRIRRAAAIGDLIVAFTGREIGPDPHAVRWAGIVGGTLGFADYWNGARFQGKKPGRSACPDNIYRPTADGIVQVPNPTHDARHAATDISGARVLFFDRRWRFGDAAPVMPAEFGLRMSEGRRGHRVRDDAEGLVDRVVEWLDRQRPSECGQAPATSRSPCRVVPERREASRRRSC